MLNDMFRRSPFQLSKETGLNGDFASCNAGWNKLKVFPHSSASSRLIRLIRLRDIERGRSEAHANGSIYLVDQSIMIVSLVVLRSATSSGCRTIADKWKAGPIVSPHGFIRSRGAVFTTTANGKERS